MSRGKPRKGRKVDFSVEDVSDPNPPDNTVAGLRFTVEAASGGTLLVDIRALRPRRLAIAVASALRQLVPTMARSTGKYYVNSLKRFFLFLKENQLRVDGPEKLRASHIDDFENWLESQGKTTIYRHTILAKTIIVLRTIHAMWPDLLDEQLQARIRYTSARPFGRSTPRDAYSSYVARQLRDAARADIQIIARRLKFPQPIEHPNKDTCRLLEIAAAIIDAEGSVSYTHPVIRRLYMQRYLLGLDEATPTTDLHARRYLTTDDIVPFLVLLSLETGLEPECLKSLRTDCLRNPATGNVEIAYMKRRARGAEYKTLRVRDGASSTPGGQIRLLIELTASARRHNPSEKLWLFFRGGQFVDVIRQPRPNIDHWTQRHGIVDDNGQPLRLILSRLRKTHKALWYAKTHGDMTRFAIGHSPEVAAYHYADIPALRQLHEATIAQGFEDAASSALAPRIVTPDEEVAENAQVVTSTNAAGAEHSRADQDVWLARCDGFTKSPYAAEGDACPQPFWGCLECPNAVISARKLPAIIAFHDFIVGRRIEMSEVDWHVKFGRPWLRITRQILPAFPEGVVAEARQAAKALEHKPYLPLEAYS